MTKAPTAPAGWYPDPDDPNRYRFWTGTRWTDDRRPTMPPTGSPGGRAARMAPTARPPSAARRWLAGLSLMTWVAAILLGGLVLTGVGTGGLGGLLMMAGLIALITGVYA